MSSPQSEWGGQCVSLGNSRMLCVVAFAALWSFIISLKPHLFCRLTACIIIFYVGRKELKEVALLERICVHLCVYVNSSCMYSVPKKCTTSTVTSWTFDLRMKKWSLPWTTYLLVLLTILYDFLNLLFDNVFLLLILCTQLLYFWTRIPVYVQQSSQGQFWMIHFVSSLCQSVSVYLSVFWLTGALQLFRFVQPRKKKHLANAASYLSCSSNLLWAAGVEAEGLSLSRDVNLQPFQFHPTLQSPSAWTISRLGQRCHLLFISSTIREEKKYCIL